MQSNERATSSPDELHVPDLLMYAVPKGPDLDGTLVARYLSSDTDSISKQKYSNEAKYKKTLTMAKSGIMEIRRKAMITFGSDAFLDFVRNPITALPIMHNWEKR